MRTQNACSIAATQLFRRANRMRKKSLRFCQETKTHSIHTLIKNAKIYSCVAITIIPYIFHIREKFRREIFCRGTGPEGACTPGGRSALQPHTPRVGFVSHPGGQCRVICGSACPSTMLVRRVQARKRTSPRGCTYHCSSEPGILYRHILRLSEMKELLFFAAALYLSFDLLSEIMRVRE